MGRLRRSPLDLVLVAVALVLVAGAAVSVVRRLAFEDRAPADRRAYRAWVAQRPGPYGLPVTQRQGGHDVVCGTFPATSPRYRQCLVVVPAGRTARVVGGFRLAPGVGLGGRRSACFGAVSDSSGCPRR
jgi:hypothetical protein